MKILLDTHSMIWALLDPDKLSKKARQALEDPENRIMVSAISFWEISLKEGLGKLMFTGASAEEFPGFCVEQGWELLPLEAETAAAYGSLPSAPDHRDPFDRILAFLAIRDKCVLVSKDKSLDAYEAAGLQRLW